MGTHLPQSLGMEERDGEPSVIGFGPALQSLWANEQHPDWVQQYAFSVWARHIDLAELRVVTPGSRHFESAAWERALRGDRAVVGFVLGKLNSNTNWFHVVSHVWGKNLSRPSIQL